MNIAYIRVSTREQHTDRQDVAFEQHGITIEKVFREKISARDQKRPELQKMLEFMREGDVVYVTELARLARSMIDMYEIAQKMMAKGVQLKSLKENVDLASPTGKFTFGIFALMAEFERDIIRQRQREGIDAAMANGKTWGRVREYGLDPRESHDIFTRYKNKLITKEEAIELFGGSQATFYNHYREWKQVNGYNKRTE